jgi:hypothetical protein
VPIAIFDIDGVLADVRHRVHWVERRPKKWVDFFQAAPDDGLLDGGRDHMAAALASGLDIMYLTGRPEWCRRDTVQWLAQHNLPSAPLHMRPDDDHRAARFYKLEIAQSLAAEHEIVEIIDDDSAVVALLRGNGFTVIHATWMDGGTNGVDAILREAQEVEGRT